MTYDKWMEEISKGAIIQGDEHPKVHNWRYECCDEDLEEESIREWEKEI